MLRSWEHAVPFVQGESGNQAGRPPGSRNTRTLLCERFLDARSEGLTRTLVNLANGGDGTALRLCIDRILPRRANRPVPFELPRVDSAKAARQAVADIIAAMGRAELALVGEGTRNNGNNENNKNTMDVARLAAGDPSALADKTGARRHDGDPPSPRSASPGRGADNGTMETMRTTKIQ
jgi:hypothetical protein